MSSETAFKASAKSDAVRVFVIVRDGHTRLTKNAVQRRAPTARREVWRRQGRGTVQKTWIFSANWLSSQIC